MKALTVSIALAALGCSTTDARMVGREPLLVWEELPPPAPALAPLSLTPDEARDIALAHEAAHSCELTARALRRKDRQRGWAVMQQCVLRPDFTDLEMLVSPPWLTDLSQSGREAELLAHVVAVRGGDVPNDLRVLRRRKMPVFSLQAALAEPEAYRGRLVLMRGSTRGGRSASGVRALRLVETKVMAESEWVPVGPRSRTTHDLDTRDHSGGSARAQLAERTLRSEGQMVEVLHNVSVDTGLEILASVEGEAPFLEAGTDYVLVLRFDGTREVVSGTELEEEAIGTVVEYFEPENGFFARLGR